MSSGIYQIRNLINGKIYIGQSEDLNYRWDNHKTLMKGNRHPNIYLQNAWNKDGEKKFIFEVKENCEINALDEREQWWIDNTPCMYYQHGYNISKDCKAPMRGRKHTPEARRKIGEAAKIFMLGKKASEETKEKLRISHLGQIAWNKGKKYTQIAGEKHYLFGKQRSEETKRKMSESKKGKYIGENSHRGKLTNLQIKEMKEKYSTGNYTYKSLAQEYGVYKGTIGRIFRGETYYA